MALLRRAEQAETVLSLWGRLWELAGHLGIKDQISAAAWLISASVFAVVVWLVNNVPWYVLVLLGMLFATLSIHLYNKLRVAWLLRGVKTFDVQKFADECLAFYRDFSQFMVGRGDARPPPGNPAEDAHKQWEANVIHSQRTDRLMMERFAPRAYSIAHQMQGLGIPPPPMFHFPHGDTSGASIYIGMVGELLNKGLLEEARKLDPRVTWGASFR